MPELSVLIPVYNEERTLERLLDAVEERPEVSEIVIVDDGSTDATARDPARGASSSGRRR